MYKIYNKYNFIYMKLKIMKNMKISLVLIYKFKFLKISFVKI